MNVVVTMDRPSVARTQAGLDRLRKYALTGPWNALNRLALFFAQSCHAATPIANKNREVMINRTRGQKPRYFVHFPFGVTSKGSRMADMVDKNWYGTYNKEVADQIKVISYRGGARASWGGIIRKMGVTRWNPASPLLNKIVRTSNHVIFQRNQNPQRIIAINRFTKMNAIAPGIESMALMKARNRMASVEKRKFERGMAVEWRAAA